MEKDEVVNRVQRRLETVRSCPGPEGCSSCDCYYLLMFYLMEELSSMNSPEAKTLLGSILKEFEGRKKLRLHGCRGCKPCDPAEWATELAKKKGQR